MAVSTKPPLLLFLNKYIRQIIILCYTGGLYAGATAGGNVKASAGLGGIVGEGKTVGGGYSSAQAGGKTATSVLVGDKAEIAARKEERRRLKELNRFLKELKLH